MLPLPVRFATVILPFAAMFVQQRTWRHAQLLLLGALLTPVSARCVRSCGWLDCAGNATSSPIIAC
jgi:hypothetical protein